MYVLNWFLADSSLDYVRLGEVGSHSDLERLIWYKAKTIEISTRYDIFYIL